MSEWLMNSNAILVFLAVVAGMVIGGACIEALRRLGRLPLPNPVWQILAIGGGILLGGTLLGACAIIITFPWGGAPPPEPTPCPTAVGAQTPCPTQGGPAPVDTKTLAPKPPTNTPEVRPTRTPRITATLTATASSSPAPTETAAAPIPSNFNITLVFSPDTGGCGFGGSSHPYSVSISDATMALTQVDAGITSTGTFDPATGAFNVSASGLPGTETYIGDIDFDGTTITMSGAYSYGNDPNLPCPATSSVINGTTTVP